MGGLSSCRRQGITRVLDDGVHLQCSDLTLDPECRVGSLRIKVSKTDPFQGGGGGGVRLPLLHRLCSLSLHCVTPVAWHTPHHCRPVVCIPGRVIPDPGPLGAHPPCNIPFLLRPEHPLLLHRGGGGGGGGICCGCHGLLLGHDPGPRAVAERLLQVLRTAPLHVCVPSPSPHVAVFRVTWGHSGDSAIAGNLWHAGGVHKPRLLNVHPPPPLVPN